MQDFNFNPIVNVVLTAYNKMKFNRWFQFAKTTITLYNQITA
jgi:hypothetical protein